jgi:UDP-GlcNAc:undecaprenyl-phosphate GlcNAc-1-phosphate transferase
MQEKIIFFILIAFNFLFIFQINKISKWIGLYDLPDKNRKLHKHPVPLLGGVLIFSLLVVLFLIFTVDVQVFSINFNFSRLEFIKFLFFSTLIFALGIVDDKIQINPNYKLIFFLVLSLLYLNLDETVVISELRFTFSETFFNLGHYSIPFTTLCILLFINAFNMFDGINLQCGFYSFFIFFIVLIHGNYYLLSFFILVQIIFFLFLNYKGHIFLGDNGSLLLGFLISILIIKNYNFNFEFLYADQIFLLMMIPGVDLLRLAMQRLLKKKHPFSPDREHLHHYLIANYGFLKTSIIVQSLIVFPLLYSIFFGNTFLVILVTFAIYAFIIFKLCFKTKN